MIRSDTDALKNTHSTYIFFMMIISKTVVKFLSCRVIQQLLRQQVKRSPLFPAKLFTSVFQVEAIASLLALLFLSPQVRLALSLKGERKKRQKRQQE